jgi:hypothetical protein
MRVCIDKNRLGDGNGFHQCSTTQVVPTLRFVKSNANTTEQTPAMDVAFVTVRLSDGRLGYQPITIRNASSELQKTVEELQATVAQLTEQLKEQGTQIQKVSARLEASKPAPQVVLNDQ